MFQALGQFTVEWKKRGPLYYACWFPHSNDYFKCAKGLQGAKVVTKKNGDYGIVKVGPYLPFPHTQTIEKATQEKLLELPRPFFVSQFLRIYQEPEVHRPVEKFEFPESKET